MKKFVIAGIIAMSLFASHGTSEAHVFENIMACGSTLEEAQVKALNDATDMFGSGYSYAKITEYVYADTCEKNGRTIIIVNVEVN